MPDSFYRLFVDLDAILTATGDRYVHTVTLILVIDPKEKKVSIHITSVE